MLLIPLIDMLPIMQTSELSEEDLILTTYMEKLVILYVDSLVMYNEKLFHVIRALIMTRDRLLMAGVSPALLGH